MYVSHHPSAWNITRQGRQSRSYLDVTRPRRSDIARSRVIHSEEDIKSLDQGALCITAPAVLVPFPLALADIIEDAIRQPGRSHVLAPGQKRTQLVEENRRGTLLMHSLQRRVEILKTVGESAEQRSQTCRVMGGRCRNGIEHQLYEAGALGFDRDGDDNEPFFVFGTGE